MNLKLMIKKYIIVYVYGSDDVYFKKLIILFECIIKFSICKLELQIKYFDELFYIYMYMDICMYLNY